MIVEATRGILEGGSWTEGGPISALFPPPATFDHLLVYMLLPGSKSQLKVDYKAMKQHYYEGRVTFNPFLFNLMANPKVSMILD